jgi:murein DD-endopeptidase MepM/ murein hydrolase activator NlpD
MAARFMFPFPDKQLTGHFGKIRTFKGAPTTPHRGTDWGAKEGTPIPAVGDGTIRLVQYSKVLGWVIVQTVWADNKTWFVGYCHLKEKPTLKVGAKVSSGDTIGLIGNTGSASSGPHLHATLSNAVRGVFNGAVFDLYIFLSEQIKKARTSPTATQKIVKSAKSGQPAQKVCPTCKREL